MTSSQDTSSNTNYFGLPGFFHNLLVVYLFELAQPNCCPGPVEENPQAGESREEETGLWQVEQEA